MKTLTIEDAKRALPLPLLMRRLGVPPECISGRDGALVPCPWSERHKHGDRRPSFNLHTGQTRFRCFGCGAAGDAIDFLCEWGDLAPEEGVKRFLEMSGGSADAPPFAQRPPSVYPPGAGADEWGDTPEKRAKRGKWPVLRRGSNAELQGVALLRGLTLGAVKEADRRGSLLFTALGGRACWVLLSDCGRIAQARRCDGGMWERSGNEFKSWSLFGSCAAVPLGLDSLADDLRPVCIAEGGPDFLALLQLALEHDGGAVAVIGFLGSSIRLANPLLSRLARRKVRIFAHADEAGHRAAAEWAGQMSQAGCEIDAFDFAAFGCKDANDFVKLPAENRHVEVMPS